MGLFSLFFKGRTQTTSVTPTNQRESSVCLTLLAAASRSTQCASKPSLAEAQVAKNLRFPDEQDVLRASGREES